VADLPEDDDGAAAQGYRAGVNTRGIRVRLVSPALRGVSPVDVAVALVVGAVQIGGTALMSAHQNGHAGCWWGSGCIAARHLDVFAFLLLAAGPAALLARRRHPAPVLAVVFTATLLYVVIGYASGPIWISLIVAFGTAILAGYQALGWLSLFAGWVLFLWLPAAFGRGGAPSLLQAFALAAWLLVLLAAAEGLRIRRERTAEAKRQREQEALRRAGEERLRIARELHDVLAHNVSLINVQSGVALHLLEQQPEQARTALSAINVASAEALREMRAVLGVLRRVDEPLPRAPTAGLESLDALVSRSAAAGLAVHVEVEGEQHPLPASVDLAAFRIVQESLTNVTRHAQARAATVHLAYQDDELAVQIDDDGRGGSPDASANGGNGIQGMRERAAALGGELQAGPRAGGGFRVRARLPLSERR
jgi:signal transduction histidine kinase